MFLVAHFLLLKKQNRTTVRHLMVACEYAEDHLFLELYPLESNTAGEFPNLLNETARQNETREINEKRNVSINSNSVS